jgi:hypothetical protein
VILAGLRFYNVSIHAWIDAAELRAGAELNTPGNGRATVLAVRHHITALRTYNLTISDLHTYYVLAGNTPVLVHNCNGLTDLWQVFERIMGPTDGHVMRYHGYGTPAQSQNGTFSKFGKDVTGEQVIDEAMAGVKEATYVGAGEIPGTHYHIYNTGKPGFGTVDGTPTSLVKIYVSDGGNLGTIFPILPPG